VHHVDNFPQLEDQMTSFVPDIDRGKMGSPDRLDALVWALTELLVEREKYWGLIEHYKSLKAAADGEAPAA
jgi:phage terminase large subunit-like protein